MSDINLQLVIKEENGILFKRCVRKLLEGTFILREKEEKLYAFLSKESNRLDLSDYLKTIGYDILLDEKCGLAMLTVNEEDADTVGLKRANIITFSTTQYYLLLALWEVYLENLGYDEGVFISRGDLIDKFGSFGIVVVSTELRAAFKLFKKYSLIDYDEEDGGEEGKIRLYPSLQFGWDIPQFKAVAAEYLKEGTDGDADENEKENVTAGADMGMAAADDESEEAGFDEEDEE